MEIEQNIDVLILSIWSFNIGLPLIAGLGLPLKNKSYPRFSPLPLDVIWAGGEKK